jgi:vacuolar iron transporter family protein
MQFMMAFELQLEKPNVSRAWISAATMGLAYFIGMSVPVIYWGSINHGLAGGLLPMIPYFAVQNVTHALFISIAITGTILLIFGYIKSYVTVQSTRAGIYGAVQTLFIGALAASASYGIVRAIDRSGTQQICST